MFIIICEHDINITTYIINLKGVGNFEKPIKIFKAKNDVGKVKKN